MFTNESNLGSKSSLECIQKNISQSVLLLHEKAMKAATNYKKCESELLNAISAVRENKIYRYFGCASLFEYGVKILKLDPGVVYGFTTVAKKIKEVPELKTYISSGALNVSTARRIVSVITNKNKSEWFQKTQTLSLRKLEKEVARANPKGEIQERASYLNSKRVKLEMGLSESLMLKFRHAQDLECQKRQKAVDLEETLSAILDIYLQKTDPMEKAIRAEIRGRPLQNKKCEENREKLKSPASARSALPPNPHQPPRPTTQSNANLSTWTKSRPPLPAKIRHKVILRDHNQCQYFNQRTQEKCRQKRFIEIHHIQPLSEGGGHKLENLTTLCAEHHKTVHSIK